MLNKEKLAQEITVNFNLNNEQTEAALLLLETRAANMDMSLEDYMQTYHPLGFSQLIKMPYGMRKMMRLYIKS